MHDTEDAAIITAIVALGRALNLRIVAEGVETREQQESHPSGLAPRCRASSSDGRLPAAQFMEAVSGPGRNFRLGEGRPPGLTTCSIEMACLRRFAPICDPHHILPLWPGVISSVLIRQPSLLS